MAYCSSCSYKICLIAVAFVVLTLANLSLQKCTPGLKTIGYTYPPGDIVLEYGKEALNITCVVDNEEYILNLTKSNRKPSDHLRFQAYNKNVTDNVEIINNTSIRLYIENLNKSSITYNCLFDNEPVCINRVMVGTKPMKVTDFQCISYNYDNLTCSWTVPNNYVKTINNLTYTFSGRAGRLQINTCPKMTQPDNDPKMNCFWGLSTSPHYRQSQPIYNFQLTMNNTFGSTITEYIFDHYKYVQSGPPENLSVVNTTTNSIYLHWVIPNSMINFEPGLKYRILYQCEFSPKEWTLAAIEYIQLRTEVYHNLTDLKHAHELCDIRVSLRSNKSTDENMWSTNSSITYRTSSAAPGAPPKTNIGSFELVPSSTRDVYNVYIYWQQVPEEIKNGDDFRYNVSVLGNTNDEKLNMTINNAFAKFSNLNRNKKYTFAIWSENSIGSSIDKSFVTVPLQTHRPATPVQFSKIAYDNGKFELFWDTPEPKRIDHQNISIHNYTIFWCKNSKDRPYQCTGYLNWTEVPVNIQNYTVIVPESNNNIWQFAISVNSITYSSGMIWASCTVLHNKHIGTVKNFYKINASSTSIQLGWKLDCADLITSIKGYNIYYCPTVSQERVCKEKEENITILGNSSLNKGSVTGLKPYTTYRLLISIITKHGDESDTGEAVYESTLEGAPSQPLNLIENYVTNSTINISWEPPTDLNGILKYYDVYYNGKLVRINPMPSPKCLLENLTSFVNYTIYIKACTRECSNASNTIYVTTKIGTPGTIDQPKISAINDTYIKLTWEKPKLPRGRNEYYQISINGKNNDVSMYYNITDTQYLLDSCAKMYIKVRAINIDNGEHIIGPWSDTLESYCKSSVVVYYIILVLFAIAGAVFLIIFIQRVFSYCKEMKNVELKLPPGLAPTDWGNNGKMPEELHTTTHPDEPLLNPNKSSLGSVVDSSGCSSEGGSVASDTGTTISSASDSGTEQSSDLRKRLRNTVIAPPRTTSNSGYVTMPTDALNKNRTKSTGGSYCKYGVDTSRHTEPDNALISICPPDDEKPYVSCDIPTSPYVLTSELTKPTKPTNSGYVPFNHPDIIEKNPPYVMAGTKNNILMSEFVNKPEEVPMYVQVSDGGTKSLDPIWQPPMEVPKAYVSIGDAIAPNKRPAEASKGYVPHRHFDAKLLKND